MDENLFFKIKFLVQQKTTEKTNVITLLKEKVGIEIGEDQIEIKGKKIILYLSSNQKMMFLQKKGDKVLQEEGYEI